MTPSRIAPFAVSIFGSCLAGIAGTYLVWGFIYGIGSRVVTDEIHHRLEGSVTTWGGIAGAAVALAALLLLRRPAPAVLAVGHTLAIVAGCLAGSVGWQEGLWAYFGALVAVVVGAASFQVLSPRRLQSTQGS